MAPVQLDDYIVKDEMDAYCRKCNKALKACDMREHLLKSHIEHVWELEFSSDNVWEPYFPGETTSGNFKHLGSLGTLGFSISKRAERKFKQFGVLDLSGKAPDKLLRLLGKGNDYIVQTRDEIRKNVREALDMAKKHNIAVPRHVKRELTKRTLASLHNSPIESAALPNDLLVTASDKSGFLVVENKTTYGEIGEEFFGNCSMWKKRNDDGWLEFRQKWESTNAKLLEHNKWYKENSKLFQISDAGREKCAYFLVKTHKDKKNAHWQLRPITDAYKGYTSDLDLVLSRFITMGRPKSIDKAIRPHIRNNSAIWQNLSTVTKDTIQALSQLRSIKLGGNAWLLALDISNMYNEIPIKQAIRSVERYLYEFERLEWYVIEVVIAFLELVLSFNVVWFKDGYFQQIKGIAMGANVSPAVANCWMYYIEKDIHLALHPKWAGRFLDDIAALDENRQRLSVLMEDLENASESIKLEKSLTQDKQNFLDITFWQEGERIATSLFVKPTDYMSCLHRSSQHPPHVFKGICYSQFLRLLRINSHHEDFMIACTNLALSLLKRGYSWTLIVNQLNRVANENKDKIWPYKAQKKESTVDQKPGETLTFTKCAAPIYRTLRSHMNVAFRNDKSISQRYRRSKFTR
jgi:hypothetical protein